jgi:hypothetical protein
VKAKAKSAVQAKARVGAKAKANAKAKAASASVPMAMAANATLQMAKAAAWWEQQMMREEDRAMAARKPEQVAAATKAKVKALAETAAVAARKKADQAAAKAKVKAKAKAMALAKKAAYFSVEITGQRPGELEADKMGEYEPMGPQLLVNGRQVWQAANGAKHFLFYATDHKWFVGDMHHMRAGKPTGWMRTDETERAAKTPDKIQGVWVAFHKHKWVDLPDVHVSALSLS